MSNYKVEVRITNVQAERQYIGRYCVESQDELSYVLNYLADEVRARVKEEGADADNS